MKLPISDLYTHFIFMTYDKKPIIDEKIREPLENYISKLVNHNACKMEAIYANPEHVHFLIDRCPRIAEENIATIIANRSTIFINNKILGNGKFSWKPTASVYSVSKMEVDEVCRYIHFQPEYHRKLSFKQEYNDLFLDYYRTIHLDF